jgi:hypothetical protein
VRVSLQLLTFKLSSGYLFSPHHVNQGAVQKPTPQVTLYEPHTAEESLRRRRSGRNSQVLPGHPGQARELLHVLLPPHASLARAASTTCVRAKSLTNYFEVNDLFTWGYRFLVPNFQDSLSPISPFSLHALYVLHPRTTEASGIFTTTGRILFYNN